MIAVLAVEPVAVNEIAIRIECAEKRVGPHCLPDISLHLHPVGHDFRPLDLDLFTRSSLISDPFPIRLASARRVDALAVSARVNGDRVARLRHAGRCGNRLEWFNGRTRVGVGSAGGYLKLGSGDMAANRDQNQEKINA